MLQHHVPGRSDSGSDGNRRHILEPKSLFETESTRKPQRWFVLLSIVFWPPSAPLSISTFGTKDIRRRSAMRETLSATTIRHCWKALKS